jgi:hypothetical protein
MDGNPEERFFPVAGFQIMGRPPDAGEGESPPSVPPLPAGKKGEHC